MLVVWALIVIGAVSIIQYASGPPEEFRAITYSQFQHELQQRNVDTVMVSGVHVHGVFHRAVQVRVDTLSHFSLQLPVEPTDAFDDFVVRFGAVVVRDKDPPQPWSATLFSFWPYALIFMGMVILMYRHVQARRRSA